MSSGNWIRWRQYSKEAALLTKAIAEASDMVPRGAPVILDGTGMAEMFDRLEDQGFKPRWLLMNPRTFVPIRRFGRDILDIPPAYPPGHADLWGATIVTDGEIPLDVILAVDGEGHPVRFAAVRR